MKKSTKVFLIASLILLIGGGSLVFYALSRAEFDWNKLTVYAENETYDYAVAGTVRDIRIDTKQADVRVVRSTNSSCTVRAKVSSRDACTAETEDGMLTVTCVDDPHLPWYKRFWRQDDVTVTVFLPGDAYERLEIATGSGDVYVSDALSFVVASTKTGSGDVEFVAPVSDGLSVTTSSGDVAVKRMGCEDISVTSQSGEICLDTCRSDSVSAFASSGCVSISNCSVQNLQTNTASGDIMISQVEASEQIKATSSSGDIVCMYSTAADMNITAKSGDVSGTLTEPMLFDVRSDSGDIVVPASAGTNRCTVRTGSGDITFVLQEADEG
ncbi:MAG: DUF4097 family beta strand repeat protein [Clostridia bacterium]|nr:DUF4097 family beta strand repeat protein [Clostridia bacterium]